MSTEHSPPGSSFEDFLAEEDILEEVTTTAVKRVIAWQIAEAMKAGKLTRRHCPNGCTPAGANFDRLLSADDTGLTLETLTRAA